MADWDERLEGEELASDAQWQTAEIRSAKPNWTSFASSKFLSDAYAPYPALPSPPLPPPRVLAGAGSRPQRGGVRLGFAEPLRFAAGGHARGSRPRLRDRAPA